MKKKLNIILFLASEKGVIFLRNLLKKKIYNEIFVVLKKEDSWEKKYNYKIKKMLKKNIIFYDNKENFKKVLKRTFINFNIDLLFAVGWRYKIEKVFYQKTKIGSFIIHDSLLPKNKGCAPLNWSLINGEKFTGVSLIQMKEKIDSGDIVLQKKIKITKNDDIASLHDKVLSLYASFVILFFSDYAKLIKNKKKQNTKFSTYNKKRFPKDGFINWHENGKNLINFIKALAKPWPGAFSVHLNKILFVWDAKFKKKKIDKNLIGSFYKSKNSFYYNCKDGRILIKKYSIKNINPYLKKVYL